MKKRYLILPILAMTLVGCRKTEEAFEHGQYNSPVFDNNYYTEWDGVDKVEIAKTDTIHVPNIIYIENREIKNTPEIPYDFEVRNLIKEEDKFSYGYLSKLYDGRLRCDGLTTRSRVQLNKTGYGTFFPKEYRGSESIALALRGATTIDFPSDAVRKDYIKIKVDVTVKFYVRIEGTNKYNEVDIIFSDLPISSDNHGNTTYVEFPFSEENAKLLYGADAMSFEYSLSDKTQYSGYNITDDFTDPDKEKEHFAIMLYEVLLPGSKWY